MCPGDRLVFTCIISDVSSYWNGEEFDAMAYWREDNGVIRELYNGYTLTYDSFLLSPIIDGTTAVVIATNEAAPVSLDGTSASCSHSHQSNTFTKILIETAGY